MGAFKELLVHQKVEGSLFDIAFERMLGCIKSPSVILHH
jgi:hypothetical protein